MKTLTALFDRFVLLSGALLTGAVLWGRAGAPHWLGEMLLSVLPQLALAALLGGVFATIRRRRRAATVFAAGFILAATGMGEHFRAAAPPLAEADMTIVWANVLGRDEALRQTIARAEEVEADLVLIAETPRRLSGPALTTALGSYKEQYGAIDGAGSSVSAFSRTKLHDFALIPVAGRKSLRFTFAAGDESFAIAAVHPTIPLSAQGVRRRNAHLLKSARALQDMPGPRVLLGDFNMVPWSGVARDIARETGFARVA